MPMMVMTTNNSISVKAVPHCPNPGSKGDGSFARILTELILAIIGRAWQAVFIRFVHEGRT